MRSGFFLTIWTPPERLRRQIYEGEIKPKTTLGIFHGNKRHKKIAKEYEDPARIIHHYRNWFAYTRTKSTDHVVVCLSDPVRLYTVDEWEEVAAQ